MDCHQLDDEQIPANFLVLEVLVEISRRAYLLTRAANFTRTCARYFSTHMQTSIWRCWCSCGIHGLADSQKWTLSMVRMRRLEFREAASWSLCCWNMADARRFCDATAWWRAGTFVGLLDTWSHPRRQFVVSWMEGKTRFCLTLYILYS